MNEYKPTVLLYDHKRQRLFSNSHAISAASSIPLEMWPFENYSLFKKAMEVDPFSHLAIILHNKVDVFPAASRETLEWLSLTGQPLERLIVLCYNPKSQDYDLKACCQPIESVTYEISQRDAVLVARRLEQLMIPLY